MDQTSEAYWDGKADRAIRMLRSLTEGDRGVVEAVKFGQGIVPELRRLLFERDRSGLFNARLRAVDALTALRAYDVLAEFVRLERRTDDPVEKLGDEVVISAAARGIARSREEWAFRLLLDLAQLCPFRGVIAALGSFRRTEAIPALTAALNEDETRMSAEGGLKAIGRPATNALIDAANMYEPGPANESETSLRRRRSALCLLVEVGLSPVAWPRLRQLVRDGDAQVAMLACKLCLDVASPQEHPVAVQRLRDLRRQASWLEQIQIDQYLASSPRRSRA